MNNCKICPYNYFKYIGFLMIFLSFFLISIYIYYLINNKNYIEFKKKND